MYELPVNSKLTCWCEIVSKCLIDKIIDNIYVYTNYLNLLDQDQTGPVSLSAPSRLWPAADRLVAVA